MLTLPTRKLYLLELLILTFQYGLDFSNGLDLPGLAIHTELGKNGFQMPLLQAFNQRATGPPLLLILSELDPTFLMSDCKLHLFALIFCLDGPALRSSEYSSPSVTMIFGVRGTYNPEDFLSGYDSNELFFGRAVF